MQVIKKSFRKSENSTVTRESNCITSVWNNLTEGDGGKDTDLSSLGN